MELLILFFEFFKIGLFTFGGGYAMIPLIKESVVTHNWVSEADFYSLLGICESTPGPIAINMATFIGSFNGGFLGSLIATLGVTLPSFIIILLIAMIFKKVLKNKSVGTFLDGLKPVIIGLIFSAGLVLLMKCLGYVSLSEISFSLTSLIIFIILGTLFFSYIIIFKKRMNTILFILISASFGLLINYLFSL